MGIVTRRARRALSKESIESPVDIYEVDTVQTQEGQAGGDETTFEGQAPLQLGDNTWRFPLPARDQPLQPRRSEVHWKVNGERAVHYDGEIVTFEGDFAVYLGEAGKHDFDWHVVWQLHGPDAAGGWKGPAMGFNIRNSKWRVGGGGGHLDHDNATHNMEWSVDIKDFVDGVKTRLKITTLLSSDPSLGWISVWVDGAQVLDKWKPISKQGFSPGTYYNQYVVQRNGLYRGTQNIGASDVSGYTSSIPTYAQHADITPIVIT